MGATLITDSMEIHELQQARIEGSLSLDTLVGGLVRYECRILLLPKGAHRRRLEARKQKLLDKGLKVYGAHDIIEGIEKHV